MDSFFIENKTFDRLPEELKKKFNEYQIETVIHEEYEMNQICFVIYVILSGLLQLF